MFWQECSQDDTIVPTAVIKVAIHLCAAICQAAIEAVGKPAGSTYNPLVRSRVLRSHDWVAQAAMIDAAIPYWKEQPMPNREEVMTLLRQHYPYLAAQYGVKKIGLFGSYARDQSDETSDVDIIVEFERPLGFRFVELAEYLEHLLGLRPAGRFADADRRARCPVAMGGGRD
ncbi:nucleotidyltransferase family protein [Chloroflexus sp.]|uniref:nucleotidyltransferase family protein n=1 Tax=Chloroflexus sp. TaxID=1904827 RepID=UPI002ACEE99B|nr:nucleotidyltransferase family protein [Chloroflexus sp.]